jgi:hypothetical protein
VLTLRHPLKDKRQYVVFAMITMLIQFVFFKYLYPYPNFMQDSYNYLRSAATNADSNLWPVGYAKLIRFIGFFSHADTLLVFTQYFFYHCCALYFFFSILTLSTFSKPAKNIIFIFLFLNPAILYLSNYVTSDVYFIGVSLVWISQLFRLAWQPRTSLLTTHLLVLLLAFTIRYHALIYPVISMTVIVFCTLSPMKKVTSILATLLLIGGFISYTTYQTGKVMGTRQFSAFSGWQMASNAVYAYAHINHPKEIPIPEEFTTLHKRITTYFDTIPLQKRPDKPVLAYYLWDPASPLQPASNPVNIADNEPHLRKMAAVSPLYNNYGKFLISQYPMSYIKYYLLPNMLQYANPPAENMTIYNDGADTIWPVAQAWFGYKNVRPRSSTRELVIFDYYPAFMVFIILLFTGVWIGYLAIGGRQYTVPQFRNAFRITTYYWIVHFGFSVLASPVVLRYQLFNMILGVTFSVCLIDLYVKRTRYL